MKGYGLVGRTLAHSFSQGFFLKKFAREGITDCSYQNFELKSIEDFPTLLATHANLKGLNVTIPYKEEVIRFLTEKNEVVEEIGACNCITIEGKHLAGYNTDAIGFRKSLEPQLKSNHKKALILGSGGASKAIRYVLNQLGIDYLVVSRNKNQNGTSYEDLSSTLMEQYQLIINTTPLGMFPNLESKPPIPYQFITGQHFLFDIVYNPATTAFLAEGERRGAQISNGYEMLIYQAEESWRIWTS